jgi:hypothetical protein
MKSPFQADMAGVLLCTIWPIQALRQVHCCARRADGRTGDIPTARIADSSGNQASFGNDAIALLNPNKMNKSFLFFFSKKNRGKRFFLKKEAKTLVHWLSAPSC